MSLADVAKRAGVSLATASRVLSDSDYRVSDALREKVKEAARAIGHVPNAAARVLSSRAGKTVGVIVGDVRDPYFSEVVHGIQTVLDTRERLLYICSSHWDPQKEAEYIRLLHSNRVGAIIIACSEVPHPVYGPEGRALLESFRREGGLVVALGRRMRDARNVLPDNVGGGRMMAEHLIGLGHRRFGIIAGPKGTASREERLQGFQLAMTEAGLPLAAVSVMNADRSWDEGARSVDALMKMHPDVTCVFALTDKMALGAQTQLQRLGWRVPDDISVAGFDDLPMAQHAHPQLTTVRIDLAEMSRHLALCALAGADEQPLEDSIVVPTQLVVRGSTGPASGTRGEGRRGRRPRAQQEKAGST
jgi:LacI family transcriptional regulator